LLSLLELRWVPDYYYFAADAHEHDEELTKNSKKKGGSTSDRRKEQVMHSTDFNGSEMVLREICRIEMPKGRSVIARNSTPKN